MKFYFFYLVKIFSSKMGSINSLSNYSIIFSSALTVIFIILTLSTTSAFKDNIIKKIVEIDGFARVYPKDYDLEESNIENNAFNANVEYISFFEKQFIIRNKNKSDGINLLAINNSTFISNYIINENPDIHHGIYIGSILSDNLELKIGDSAFLINNDNYNREIKEVVIKGIFKTSIPFYDEFYSFSINSDKGNLEFFNKSYYDGYIVLSNNIYENLDFLNKNYHVFTWEERHGDFISWLYSYDVPIKILLFFVFLISIINNISIFNIDLINKNKDIFLLKSIGFSKMQVIKLFLLKNFILNLVAIFIGGLVSFFLIYIELRYKFIKIPENIYFSDSLPISFDYLFFIFPAIILLSFSIISTFVFSLYNSRDRI